MYLCVKVKDILRTDSGIKILFILIPLSYIMIWWDAGEQIVFLAHGLSIALFVSFLALIDFLSLCGARRYDRAVGARSGILFLRLRSDKIYLVSESETSAHGR